MSVSRWTRYGKDRLYVRADDGADIGWWDLHADQGHPAYPEMSAELARAVEQWRLTHPGLKPLGLPRTTPLSSADSAMTCPTVAPSSRPSPIVDLACNAPGAQLLGQVEAARAAGQKPTLLRRLFLGKHAYSTWERGLIGEQLVEQELRSLVKSDPWWGFINSIPVGDNGADIDHLVVGLAGVFTVNTKYHRGCNVWVARNTYMVNGQRQPFIRNARQEAQRASRLLSRACGFDVRVQGLVVPTKARSFTVREQPTDVRVVNRAPRDLPPAATTVRAPHPSRADPRCRPTQLNMAVGRLANRPSPTCVARRTARNLVLSGGSDSLRSI